MFVKIPLLNFAYLMLALESLLFQLCLILSAKVVDPLSGRKSKDEGGVSAVEVPPNVGPTIKASAASQMESAMAALSVELSKHGSFYCQSLRINQKWFPSHHCIHSRLSAGSPFRIHLMVHCIFHANTESISVPYWKEADATIGNSCSCLCHGNSRTANNFGVRPHINIH